jgi:hypothetical protein
MPRGPIRRSQLIAPFGTGAMIVVREGASLISCGLDHWYKSEFGETSTELLDTTEFKIEEWRLQRLLRVNHFRTPSDFRRKVRGDKTPNAWLTVPFLRFPRWHFCPFCNRLDELPLSIKEKPKCKDCQSKGKMRILLQVPFVAICEAGHIQDFPWREWVHGTAAPACNKPLRLKSTGGASLASRVVVCECSKERNLANITNASADGSSSHLSSTLDTSKAVFHCRGLKPWLGTDQGEGCTRPLRGSLRSASNVYFADVKSAIYLPRDQSSAPEELIRLLSEPPLSELLDLVEKEADRIKALRIHYRAHLHGFSDQDLKGALRTLFNEPSEEAGSKDSSDDEQTAFRRAEFNILKKSWESGQLQVRKEDLNKYSKIGSVNISELISNITLAYKLRETRVLAGFTRIFPDNSQTLEARKALLRIEQPKTPDEDWLPAYVVFGEGIFIEFNEQRLAKWEAREDVKLRVKKLSERYRKVQSERKLREKNISARFVMMHTFSHLLMNRLIFECGYSSAALRERIYVSTSPRIPMAGLLLYTAAGDAEGSLGGLVRMGKAGYFEPVLERAISGGRWCSADPVCMEIAEDAGQGPDACNMAACHNCALVPETACEEFNRFLDRALIVGDLKNPKIGFFSN